MREEYVSIDINDIDNKIITEPSVDRYFKICHGITLVVCLVGISAVCVYLVIKIYDQIW